MKKPTNYTRLFLRLLEVRYNRSHVDIGGIPDNLDSKEAVETELSRLETYYGWVREDLWAFQLLAQ